MSGKQLSDLYAILVEPSSAQAKFIMKELHGAGLSHIEIFDTGATALRQMHSFPPDLVISSMYLPDMTATDLVYQMREDEYTHDIAFMLISSESDFAQLDPIKQAGVTAMLPKPFESSQLKRALYNTLDILNLDLLDMDPASLEDLRVLVVDDSFTSRNLIKRVLKGMGIEHVVEADDGATAVPLLDEQFFDFVVTDYNMPQMDGRELLEHIRNNSNQRSIPVLMVTSVGNRGKLAAVAQAGVSGICDKPFEVDTIRQMIQTVMSDV